MPQHGLNLGTRFLKPGPFHREERKLPQIAKGTIQAMKLTFYNKCFFLKLVKRLRHSGRIFLSAKWKKITFSEREDKRERERERERMNERVRRKSVC